MTNSGLRPLHYTRASREAEKFARFAEAVERERGRLVFADSHRELVFTSARGPVVEGAGASVSGAPSDFTPHRREENPKSLPPEYLAEL